jgi:hypothetical protein
MRLSRVTRARVSVTQACVSVTGALVSDANWPVGDAGASAWQKLGSVVRDACIGQRDGRVSLACEMRVMALNRRLASETLAGFSDAHAGATLAVVRLNVHSRVAATTA